jgi:hypothetical protein
MSFVRASARVFAQDVLEVVLIVQYHDMLREVRQDAAVPALVDPQTHALVARTYVLARGYMITSHCDKISILRLKLAGFLRVIVAAGNTCMHDVARWCSVVIMRVALPGWCAAEDQHHLHPLRRG